MKYKGVMNHSIFHYTIVPFDNVVKVYSNVNNTLFMYRGIATRYNKMIAKGTIKLRFNIFSNKFKLSSTIDLALQKSKLNT